MESDSGGRSAAAWNDEMFRDPSCRSNHIFVMISTVAIRYIHCGLNSIFSSSNPSLSLLFQPHLYIITLRTVRSYLAFRVLILRIAANQDRTEAKAVISSLVACVSCFPDILESVYFFQTYRRLFGSQLPAAGIAASRTRENCQKGKCSSREVD